MIVFVNVLLKLFTLIFIQFNSVLSIRNILMVIRWNVIVTCHLWSSKTVYCWSAVWPRITLVIFGCTTFRLMWCVSEVKMVIHTQAAMGVGGSKARDFIYIPGRDLASVCSVIEQMHFSHGESRVFTGCTRPCCQAQPLGWL